MKLIKHHLETVLFFSWLWVRSIAVVTFHRNDSYTSFVQRLMSGYNEDQDPGQKGRILENTHVNVSIHISSLSEVNIDNMDFRVDMYLAQEWVDERLQFEGLSKLKVHGKFSKTIWKPDTFFPNEKKAMQHMTTKLNTMVQINPDGTVYFNQRITVTFSCVMDLHFYPMDTQTCPILIEAYGHNSGELKYSWLRRPGESGPVTFAESAMQAPDFAAPTYSYSAKTSNYGGTTDSFSSLRVDFVLHRRIEAYVLDSYVPFICIVIVSLSSCWINPLAAPARASIGVITVLSIVVHNSGMQRRLAHVSYLKALDLYMIVCLTVVLLAWVEFCMVHYLANRENKQKQRNLRLKYEEENGVHSHKCRPKKRCNKITHTSYCPKCKCIFTCCTTGPHWSSEEVDRASRWIFPLIFLIFNLVYWIWLGIHRLTQRNATTDKQPMMP